MSDQICEDADSSAHGNLPNPVHAGGKLHRLRIASLMSRFSCREEFSNSLRCIEAIGENTTPPSDLLCEFVVLEVVVVVWWWGTS
jgi:hypothetical protein